MPKAKRERRERTDNYHLIKQRQTNHLYDLKQTLRDTRPGSNKRREPFHEDFPWAGGFLTEVLADLEQKTDSLSSTGEVGNLANVTTVHARSGRSTQRAARSSLA